MEYDAFFNFMFHICDTWTFTAAVQEAIDLLDSIMLSIEEATLFCYFFSFFVWFDREVACP